MPITLGYELWKDSIAGKFIYFKSNLNYREENGLNYISCHIIQCYTKPWFRATNPIETQLNDILLLIKTLKLQIRMAKQLQ